MPPGHLGGPKQSLLSVRSDSDSSTTLLISWQRSVDYVLADLGRHSFSKCLCGEDENNGFPV